LAHGGGAETPDHTQQEASKPGLRQRLIYLLGSQTAEGGDERTEAVYDSRAARAKTLK